jgi:hypothetical protein
MKRALALALSIAGLSSACTLNDQARSGYAEIEIAEPPPAIESYPHGVYRGFDAYFYEGHWYMKRGPRWVYLEEEPGELHRYRLTHTLPAEESPSK